MRRKRTITATRLALAANILEILGIIAFSVAMFLIYVIVSAFAGAFAEGNSFSIVFKLGVAPIIFALFMIVFIITLISPLATVQMCINTPSVFLVSVTVITASPQTSVPVSPI